MWQAIGAVFGLATSANDGAQAQYQAQRAEYEASVGFTRAKDMSYYSTYAGQQKAIMIIAALGFILLIAVLIIASKTK